MKKGAILGTLVALLCIFLSGCEAIEGIFQAGMWWGIIVVIGIIALIGWILSRSRR